ncbi:uncharacterized protein LOC128737842 [Sabethes cyaneus]|uniref:uncharacterized protein LOC128737842 n=1 Tax=Sabethes cyaneus TaxID=53552 RepID=UPI00237D4759|nr:uncharacterized protein LOC128737842 [Sabethes cyaneus]
MSSQLLNCLIVITICSTLVVCDKYVNKFNDIYGCKQTNAVNGYTHAIEFIPTENFQNTGHGQNSTLFRIGILGPSYAVIRFSKIAMPYNKDTVHEIAFGTSYNQYTEVRRQIRNNAKHYKNQVLATISTPKILSELEPFVITVEFLPGGSVQLTRLNETVPFLVFSDPKAEISYNYIGFSSHLVKVIFFFDCPMMNFHLWTDTLKL